MLILNTHSIFLQKNESNETVFIDVRDTVIFRHAIFSSVPIIVIFIFQVSFF
jgi:hypothetical protein